jgi:hypothetical protein
MISPGFRQLMTRGYALANKSYFKELGPHEFDQWIRDCRHLLSRCKPEPHLPWFPDPRHIEEIVMLLASVRSRISRGETIYTGLL